MEIESYGLHSLCLAFSTLCDVSEIHVSVNVSVVYSCSLLDSVSLGEHTIVFIFFSRKVTKYILFINYLPHLYYYYSFLHLLVQ